MVAPVELLKIRQQLQVATPGDTSYVGPLQLLRRLLTTEGLPGAHVSRVRSVAVAEASQAPPRLADASLKGLCAASTCQSCQYVVRLLLGPSQCCHGMQRGGNFGSDETTCPRTEHRSLKCKLSRPPHDPKPLVAGLFRGFGVTLVRDVPCYGIYFCIYDASRDALDPGSRACGPSNAFATLFAGTLLGRKYLPAEHRIMPWLLLGRCRCSAQNSKICF